MTTNHFSFVVEPFTYMGSENEEEEAGRRRQSAPRPAKAPRGRTQRPSAQRSSGQRPSAPRPSARPKRARRPQHRSLVVREPAHMTSPVSGSEQIRWVQNTLNQVMNLSLPVDGLMGTTTRSALRSFQEKQGLPVDGIVGPETEQALRDASGGQPPAESTGEPSGLEPSAEEPAGESFEFFNFEEETGTAYRPTLRSGSRGETVTDLQSRLQRAGHDPGPIDGIFGSRTDAAVRSFQRAQSITVDGIVGPQTWGRLLGTTPGTPSVGVPSTPPMSTQVDTPLPASGTGFYSYTSADKRYGTLDTIKAMQSISAAWNRAHPGGPRIGVGNISKRGGGAFPPHSTHREGLNVDIRPLRNDSREEAVTYKDATYSRTLTQDLVNLIYANPVLAVSSILFNDPGVQRVNPYTGHDNHLHLTFTHPIGSGQPTTGYPSTGSALRTKIVQLTLQEQKRWQYGSLKETDAAAKSILEEYWKIGVGLDSSTAKAYAADSTSKHWSAAFICWVMRRAGVTDKDFKYSSFHSTYIAAAYQNAHQGSTKPFKAYSVREMVPRAGDLVCYTYEIDKKGTKPPADLALVRPGTPGYHSNIVVSVTPTMIEVIGGNVTNTVGSETVPIDANGLIKGSKYFAVIRVG